MLKFKVFVQLMVVSSVAIGNCHWLCVQQEQKKTITRVKRPDLSNSERNKIYFDDIFTEGLKGPKPAVLDFEPATNSTGAGTVKKNAPSEQWSNYISRSAIEDEVKILHRVLQKTITTPSAFNSKFSDVRQQFDILAMLFGIIHEYDQDVRWKKYAGSFQRQLVDASAKILTPSRPTFQLAKTTRDDLGQLIRGGGIQVSDEGNGKLQWAKVVQRGPIMDQLDLLVGEALRPAVSSKDEFDSKKDDLLRNANLVSAMAHALTMEGQDDADDDGYIQLANRMGSAAKQLIDATQNNEFDAASTAVNRIEQSCVDCHSEWRG